ncbi:MAG TPA: hypothetical protein VL128_17545 [Candidatus Eisenbacteria bacterium]|nr:hypothetical protein [Candidatus Eisenbacteria bacterium]
MHSLLKRMIFPIALGAIVGLCGISSAPAWTSHGDDEIVGTWMVTVQLNNCSGVNLGPSFASLLTFADGGTFMEDTLNPSFAPGQRSAGHGIWEYQGHHSYSAKSIAFINFTTTTPLPGFTQGTQTITQTTDFDHGPDQWTAAAQVQFADATGTVYRQACANATAKRFE